MNVFFLFSDAWKYHISVSKESVEKAKAMREMALRKRKTEADGMYSSVQFFFFFL